MSLEPTAHLSFALEAWGFGPGASAAPVTVGLINRTFVVGEGARRVVLQRVNPIFEPSVNLDIEAVTRHLEREGEVTPRLVPTREGALWATDPEGRWWRALTFLPGRVVTELPSRGVARAAGALVGRFHRAVSTLEHTFQFTRLGVHDTPRHLAVLKEALTVHREHPGYASVAPVGEAVLAHAERLSLAPESPSRVTHGDLKISNVLFDEGLSRGVALLDLDTLGRLPLGIELGDAFRSWCNPVGESGEGARFDAEVYREGIEGYASVAGEATLPSEREALVGGIEQVSLELAARFAADALRECYFGWDPSRFPSRSEHNRVRALSQLSVARSIASQRGTLEAVTRAAFAR